jgi:hypothetical protein
MTIFHRSWCILEAHCESCRGEPEPCNRSHSNLPLNIYRCKQAVRFFFWKAFFKNQDPCPTLNGTRRVAMPQVLTRRSGPITLLAKRGREPAPTNPKTGSGSDHPEGRSPQSTAQFGLTLTAHSHCSVSRLCVCIWRRSADCFDDDLR